METEPNMFYGRTFAEIRAERWITFKPSPDNSTAFNVRRLGSYDTRM